MDENQSKEIILQEPSYDKIAAALAKAQGKFRTPQLNRTAKVMKEGRLLYETHYADLQECIDCIKGPLAENGLSFVQITEDTGKDWFLVLRLFHESGQSLESVLPLNVNQTNQQLGGTMTYLKRYQISAFFGLAADFDDDGNSTNDNNVEFKSKTPNPKHAPKGVITNKAIPPEDDLDVALGNKIPPTKKELLQNDLYSLVDTMMLPEEEVKKVIKLYAPGKNSKTMTEAELEQVIKHISLTQK